MLSRLLDIVIAATVLILSSPLLLLAVIGIRISGGGPVIYRQRRIGRDGEPFELLKLRTMVPGSDPVGVGTVVTLEPSAAPDSIHCRSQEASHAA